MKVIYLLVCCIGLITPELANGQVRTLGQTRLLIDSLHMVDQQVQQDIIKERVDSLRRGLFQKQFAAFKRHKPYLAEIINQHGFPGYDKVGEEASKRFFTLVQHCDDDVAFQQNVLALMKPEVERDNADKKGFAYLTDRVLINTDKPQLYGTQVTYRDGRAVALPVANVAKLDERRAKVGLEPMDGYLQRVTKMHQEMNKPK